MAVCEQSVDQWEGSGLPLEHSLCYKGLWLQTIKLCHSARGRLHGLGSSETTQACAWAVRDSWLQSLVGKSRGRILNWTQ